MKKLYILLLMSIPGFSQVTIKVTDIPSNTPDGASIYFAGSVNSWNPGDAAYILEPDGSGGYDITIPEGTGTVEFKFTRGSWPTVEGNATGGFLPNRTFTFTGFAQSIYLTIQSWEDLGGTGGSTAAPNVSILSDNFLMPQLNTSRRIWIYLPPDYETSTKNYPVLYMQDGQNLFDVQTSFAGEWEVDETLNTLFNNGDYGAIVVGIDNGGASRLDEYSPWVNPTYGGGDGDDYMEFLAETLKPFMDANYRTRPEPAMNALIGSSMGALISTYGALEYPDVFRKIGSLSPAYWFAYMDLQNYIQSFSGSLENHRIYFVAGENESENMVSHINATRSNMIAKGIDPLDALTKFDSFGTHTEGYWKGEFGALYTWLFEDENLNLNDANLETATLYQTPSGKLIVSGLSSDTKFDIINMTGSIVASVIIGNGVHELPDNLPKGIYALYAKDVTPTKVIRF